MNGYFYYEGGILKHSGKKGSKWGYNDGARNGKRTAANYNTQLSSVRPQKIS